jgi:hypothetical protein
MLRLLLISAIFFPYTMRALLSSHNACVLLTLCRRRATAGGGGGGLGYGCGCGGYGGGNSLFRIGITDFRN